MANKEREKVHISIVQPTEEERRGILTDPQPESWQETKRKLERAKAHIHELEQERERLASQLYQAGKNIEVLEYERDMLHKLKRERDGRQARANEGYAALSQICEPFAIIYEGKIKPLQILLNKTKCPVTRERDALRAELEQERAKLWALRAEAQAWCDQEDAAKKFYGKVSFEDALAGFSGKRLLMELDRVEAETPAKEASDEYTCKKCGGTFKKAWSDEEAIAETMAVHGVDSTTGMDVVCDDCYREIMGDDKKEAVGEGEQS